MTLSAWEHQQALAGYRSWTEAQDANVPVFRQWISLWHGGKLLHYQRGGNALTTADGSTWGPARGLQAYIEHWGALPSIKRELSVDYTAEVRRAQSFRGSIDVTGFVRINRPIRPQLHCHFFCSGGQDRGGFYISTDFDSQGTNGVILTPYGSYWQFGPIALVADQSFANARVTDAANGKVGLRDYPWALNCDEISNRMDIPALRIEGFTKGIKSGGVARTQVNPGVTAMGNIGGSNFGLIENGAFTYGFELDGAKDFVRIISYRSWGFQATLEPFKSIWEDGTNVGMKLMGTDGFCCDSYSSFNSKLIVDDQNWGPPSEEMLIGKSYIPHVFTSVEIDGINGSLEWRNGYGLIKGMTSQDRIFLSGGVLSIGPSRFHVYRSGAAAINVSGTAEVHLTSPDFLLRRVDNQCFRMTGGVAVISNPVVRGGGPARAQTLNMFSQVAGSLQISSPRVIGAAASPNHFCHITLDLASNNIECPPNYTMSLPAAPRVGRYIQQSTTV